MSTPSKSWYQFRNATAEGVELAILDEIGAYGVTSKAFSAELRKYSGKRVTLRINSPGGGIIEGNAIALALRRHKGGVTVQIDALAASMATVIAMEGKPVRMAENGFFMIHNPGVNYTSGGADDLRQLADTLDKMKKGIVDAYAAKTGMDRAELEELMDAETWFTAEEAKAAGFVDEITDRVAVPKNCFDLSKFRNAPAAVDSAREASAHDKHAAPNMQFRAAILTALNLTETAEKPLTDAEITAAITTKATELTNKVTAAETKATELQTALDNKTSELTNVNAKLTKADEKATDLETQLTAKAGELSTVTEARNKATGKLERLAAKGIAIDKEEPADLAQNKGAKELTRAAFDALEDEAKEEFFRNSGKLVG